MADQPQTPQVKLRLPPRVDGFVSGSRAWFMLQYRLSGETEAGSAGTQPAEGYPDQGAPRHSGPRRDRYSPRPAFFLPLDTLPCLPKSRGLGRSPSSNLLPLLPLGSCSSLLAARERFPTAAEKSRPRIERFFAHAQGVQAQGQLPHHRDQGPLAAFGTLAFLDFDTSPRHPGFGPVASPQSTANAARLPAHAW